MNNEIKVIQSEVTHSTKQFYVELEINNKLMEISISESYNENSGSYQVDYDYLSDNEELSDEENDIIHDWVNSFKFNKEV